MSCQDKICLMFHRLKTSFLYNIKCSGINDKCVKCSYAVYIISVLSQFQITITEMYEKSLLQYVCVNKNKYVIKADT